MSEPTGKDINDIFDYQIKNQGVGVVTVKDGYVLKFTETMLQFLLDKAQESPAKQCVIFVQHQVGS